MPLIVVKPPPITISASGWIRTVETNKFAPVPKSMVVSIVPPAVSRAMRFCVSGPTAVNSPPMIIFPSGCNATE